MSESETPESVPSNASEMQEYAMFGAGCFWCTEAVFEKLDGVGDVVSGYSGGTLVDPSYKAVCSGDTGHNEVVRVSFDPARVSYADLVRNFFKMHDPTQVNRQGNDVGTQYRSGIYYFDEEQRTVAEAIKAEVDASGSFDKPIATEIVSAAEFYEAEDYHQDYFRSNPNQPYSWYIRSKLDKLGM